MAVVSHSITRYRCHETNQVIDTIEHDTFLWNIYKLYVNIQEDLSVEECVDQLTARGVTQSTLFTVHGRHFVKADNTAVPVHNESCFHDCVRKENSDDEVVSDNDEIPVTLSNTEVADVFESDGSLLQLKNSLLITITQLS